MRDQIRRMINHARPTATDGHGTHQQAGSASDELARGVTRFAALAASLHASQAAGLIAQCRAHEEAAASASALAEASP